MSKILKNLLPSTNNQFSYVMNQLEKVTGNAGVDVRLIADMTSKAHVVMRRLGLDPADTTARELYHALNSYIVLSSMPDLLLETDYVMLHLNGEIVSFNMIDAIENAHHDLPFQKRVASRGERALRGELLARYLAHPKTDDKATRLIASGAGITEDDSHIVDKGPIHEKLRLRKGAPYILAIGDIFTDAFIKIDEKYIEYDTDRNGKKWVKIPHGGKPAYEHADIVRSVGPSPNSAVSFARLGMNAGLMAWLGDDKPGQESLLHLASENVDTAMMVTQKNTPSSYWYVLRYGSDRTMFVKSEKYTYAWQTPTQTPDWIYLSYLGKDSWQLHEDLIQYLDKNSHIKLAFQPGTFHFEWGVEKLASVYRHSHIVILNREEAADVTGCAHDLIPKLAAGLHKLGPKIVVITDGPNGSYASDGKKVYAMPNYPDPALPFERTGAGDAFASTIVAALASGESLETALTWAPINSMNVVQHMGAQAGLLYKGDILKYLKNAPADYIMKEIKT